MKRRKWVYVSGPLGSHPIEGAKSAIFAGVKLWRAGCCPVIPHLFILADLVASGMGYADWLEWDLELLSRCDAILRLPGNSPGADAEVLEAKRLLLPIFRDVESAALLMGEERSHDH